MSAKAARSSARARLAMASRQLPLYRQTLSRMLRELCAAFPGAMFAVTGLSMSGAMLRGVALAAGIHYLQLLEGAGSLSLWDLTLVARDPHVMSSATLALVLLLGISAWLLFRARITTARMLEAYQAHQITRIVSQVPVAVTGVRPPRSAAQAAELVVRVVIRDAQQSAMLVRFFGRAIPALVTVAYSVPVIVYLDPVMTAALAALLGLALPLFYGANIMAYESGIIGKSSQQGATRQLLDWLIDLQDYAAGAQPEELMTSRFTISGALRRRLGVLPLYLRSLARTEFIINVVMSVALGLILVVQAPRALAGQQDWAAILAYFVFLRLAVDGLGGVFSFLSIFSKLYPSTRRYQEYIGGIATSEKGTREVVLRLHRQGLCESTAQGEKLGPGILALWTHMEPTRYSLPYLLRYEPHASSGIVVKPRDCYLVSANGLRIQQGSIRETLLLPADFGYDQLRGLVSVPLMEELERRFGKNPDLDLVRPRAGWQRLTPAAKVEIGLLVANHKRLPVVVVASDTLQILPADLREHLLEDLRRSQHLVIVVHAGRLTHASLSLPASGETLSAVVGARGDLFAIGTPTWIAGQLAEIRHLLAEERIRSRREIGDADSGMAELE